MKSTVNINPNIESVMLPKCIGCSMVVKSFFLSVLFLLIAMQPVFAVNKPVVDKEAPGVVYDEIPVNVRIEGFRNFYVDAIYSNSNVLYVNIKDLFDMLKIPCIVGPKGESISGFLENENRTYSIDYNNEQIIVGSKTFQSTKALLKETGSMYIESSLLADAFGITLNFNYRALTMTLKSDFELPAIKLMRTEKMRQNLAKVQGSEIADTVLQRNYHLFKFGALDWSLSSSQIWNGATYNQLGFGLGTELLYGEADISLNYYNQYNFDKRLLQYIWRWVDNENKIVKQAQVGKLTNQTISFLNNQVIGAVVRNSPTTVRKATGFYAINEITEPNWTVELYINNVLVDYTRADASGSYSFNVPIVYGYTTLKLKYYGPLGEERTEERTINVPYTVMPAKEFEYSLSAGIVQDSSHSRFGKGEFNYGVNRLLTVGGGLEYLSSIPTGPFIPYAKATLQPFSKLTVNAEYAYGVRTSGIVNYYFRKDMLLEIDYTKYVDGQLATHFNADVEKKIKLTLPLRFKKIGGFAKLDYTQLDYKEFSYTQANAILSLYYLQFSANSTTQINWIGQHSPYITTDLALSYRMKKGFVVRPSARYNVNEGNFMTCKAEIEKRIPFGYITASYERNFSFNDHFINVGFKYDLPFARTNVSVSHSKNKLMTSAGAQGSLAFGGDNYTHVSNNSSVGKGGILISPFLDLNRNGVFDKGEHRIKLRSVKISGGRPEYSEKDSIIRVAELNAFTSYMVEFNDYDLENIAWRFKNKTYQVLIDPNQFKRIDVPVISLGEISGQVNLDKDNSIKGLGRIIIKIHDKASKKIVAQTLSESDGYISYLGLAPGDYYACVDSLQLANLEYSVDAPCKEFSIKVSENGDIVDGIDFVLRPLLNNSPENHSFMLKPEIIAPAIEQKDAKIKEDSIVLKPETVVPVIEQKDAKLKNDSILVKPETIISASEKQDIQPKHDSIALIPETVVPVIEQKDTKLKEDSIILKPETVIPPIEQKDTKLIDDSIVLKPETVIPVIEQKDVKLKDDSIVLKPETIISAIDHKDTKLKDDSIVLGTIIVMPENKDKITQLQPDSIVQLPILKVRVSEEKTNQIQPELKSMIEPKDTLASRIQENKQPEFTAKFKEQVSSDRDSIIYIPADTLYKVQLLATSKPLKDKSYFTKLISDVPGLKIVEQFGDDGLYHYSTQATAGIEETRQLRRTIMKNGWKDSFVAIYAGKSLLDITFKPKYRRKVIPIKETIPVKMEPAVDKENKTPQTETEVLNTKTENQIIKKQIIIESGHSKNLEERVLEVNGTTSLIPGDTIFSVQLLALSAPIKIKDYFGLLLSRIPGLKINETRGADGLYHYSVGLFGKIEDARAFNHRIRNSGWIDSFISSYTDYQQKE